MSNKEFFDDEKMAGMMDDDFTSKGFLGEEKKAEMLEKELKIATDEALIKTASATAAHQSPYPTPFLNLSDMKIPNSTIEIFQWCKYYYTFDPLISGAINALATFPITEIHLEEAKNNKESLDDEKSDSLKLYENIIFKKLDIYRTLISIGIDYYLYGNCYVFGEMQVNPKTGLKEWKTITRLDPSKVIIDYNPTTGEKKFKWKIPNKVRQIVRSKKPKSEYDRIPSMIKKAVRLNKAVVLDPERVYHFSRATDSMGDNTVYGVPIVANVLKLLMYRNVLRQAQEAIAREHIVPMRIYYLDKTENYNPHADFNKVAQNLASDITKSAIDPNRKVVSPVPVNCLNIGGNGRSLLVTPEIEQIQSEILAGMNVPREFIFGGVSYSGSSVSLKILENQFITYRLLLKDFLQNFIIKGMAKERGEWVSESDDDDLISVKMIELKMQDDVQQKQLIIQLNSAGKCSNDLLWKTMGIDSEKMKTTLEKEALEGVELKYKMEIAELELSIQKADLELKLQQKQLENQMKLQQMQMAMQQKLGMMGQEQQVDAQQAEQQQAEQQVDPQQAEQQAMQQQAEPQQAEQQAMQQQAEPQQAEQQQAEQQQSDGYSDGQQAIDTLALNLIKMPEKSVNQVMGKLDPRMREVVAKRMAELEASYKNAQPIDMRPMPEKKPPRRDGLK